MQIGMLLYIKIYTMHTYSMKVKILIEEYDMQMQHPANCNCKKVNLKKDEKNVKEKRNN